MEQSAVAGPAVMSARPGPAGQARKPGVQIGFLVRVGAALVSRHDLLGRQPSAAAQSGEGLGASSRTYLGTGEFWPDLKVTLSELAVAFALSCTTGVTLGYLVSRSSYLIRVFEPLLAGIYSVPIILFLPLYVLFFGLGPWSKIALGATISFFPIVLNTIAGFGYVDRIFITAARSMGASDCRCSATCCCRPRCR